MILVAYFSVTGTTEILANKIKEVLNADIFKIEPSIPYTKEDLNWMNGKSRSSLEMKDLSSRPQIKNKVENIEKYTVLLIGFPIWWYKAPTIINTFLESYDLSGATIIPFAISGGSNMGKTNDFLAKSCKGANLKEGKVFNKFVSNEDLKEYFKSINLL